MAIHSFANKSIYDADSKHHYQATCGCGWQGELQAGYFSTATRDDYRQHIEEALGGDGYYEAPVACKNCASHHVQSILTGTTVHSENCIRCGTTMLVPRNQAWDDAKPRRGLLGW